MPSAPTGESGQGCQRLLRKSQFLANTDVQEARCESYDLAYDKSGERIKRYVRNKTGFGGNGNATAMEGQAARYDVAVRLKRSSLDAARLEEAAAEEDFMELTNAITALSERLNELWKVRQLREEYWGQAINFLQIAMNSVQSELLTLEQCKAIRIVIDQQLSAGILDGDDVKSCLAILQKAELDPWAAISARSESDL